MSRAAHDFAADWAACWPAGKAPGELLTALLQAWGEPARHYHGLQHLAECLTHWRASRHLAQQPGEVGLALWFHDAVYAPRAADNEARSAAWASEALQTGGMAAEAAARVADLVMATCHQAEPAEGDASLVVDIDLAILGAVPARFAEYEAQVRAEYAWVEETVYRSKRREVLARFLVRDQIYRTACFQDRYEQAARANLAGALMAIA